MDFSERRDAYVRTYVRTYVCTYIYHTAVLCLLLPALACALPALLPAFCLLLSCLLSACFSPAAYWSVRTGANFISSHLLCTFSFFILKNKTTYKSRCEEIKNWE